MTVDIEKLEMLAKAATKSEWSKSGSYIYPTRKEGGTTYVESWRSIALVHDDADRAFIAAANPAAVLELIAENKTLTKIFADAPEIPDADIEWLEKVRALKSELDQQKAELAGLKTGYEAYERVNAELRAECEKLRKDAERLNWLGLNPGEVISSPTWSDPLGDVIGYSFGVDGEYRDIRQTVDAAMSKEQSHD